MIYNKVEQLIKVAEVMVDGPVNDFPKNLTNFKLVLEGVKIALEQQKDEDKKSLAEQVPGYFVHDDVPRKNYKQEGEQSLQKDEVPLVEPEVVAEAEAPKPKRKRRTKAEMLAAATEAAEKLETKVDDAIDRVEKAGAELDIPAEKVEAIKNTVAESIKAQPVNSEEVEDWEKEDTEKIPWKTDEEKGEFDDDVQEIADLATGPEEEITALITKYPDPLNLALLETREEKVNLVKDMNSIKELVGNENTADIKACLSKLELEDAITVRAYKFLMVLPHLEIELK